MNEYLRLLISAIENRNLNKIDYDSLTDEYLDHLCKKVIQYSVNNEIIQKNPETSIRYREMIREKSKLIFYLNHIIEHIKDCLIEFEKNSILILATKKRTIQINLSLYIKDLKIF